MPTLLNETVYYNPNIGEFAQTSSTTGDLEQLQVLYLTGDITDVDKC